MKLNRTALCLLVGALGALGAFAPVSSSGALAAQQPAASASSGLGSQIASTRAASLVPAVAQATPPAPPTGFMGAVDRIAARANSVIAAVLFFDVIFWDNSSTPQIVLPFVVLWLVIASVYLTFRMGFINFRAFRHAIRVTAGKYTDPKEPGDVSHFEALSTALSATVGLGNIAGVAIAVMLGGPGATFWMIIAGFFGMTAKFTECTLGQMYRDVRSEGRGVLGGPVQYLSRGFAEHGMARTGKFLAILFAILCIGGSLGGGNAFQVNQSMNAIQETVPWLATTPWAYGVIMTVLVGIVIIGGIKRIANVADKIVPLMAIIYISGALVVIVSEASAVPAALTEIVRQAFTPDAAYGGFVGVLVMGFRRAAFSNEAGAGSAAIAHSAAKTKYPVREGIVALLEPFIDTVVICTMTALVINITGAYNNPAYADLIAGTRGAALTSRAFSEHISWFPYVVSTAVFLFAYSTMISWSYYGERCSVWLFGDGASKYYKALFLAFVFLGSVITSQNVLDFGDLMILGMAVPNLIGVYLLHGKVRIALNEYWAKYKAGEFPIYK